MRKKGTSVRKKVWVFGKRKRRNASLGVHVLYIGVSHDARDLHLVSLPILLHQCFGRKNIYCFMQLEYFNVNEARDEHVPTVRVSGFAHSQISDCVHISPRAPPPIVTFLLMF